MHAHDHAQVAASYYRDRQYARAVLGDDQSVDAVYRVAAQVFADKQSIVHAAAVLLGRGVQPDKLETALIDFVGLAAASNVSLRTLCDLTDGDIAWDE